MRKQQQSYFLDFLLDNVPGLNIGQRRVNGTEDSAADILYGIWKNPKNRISSKTYKKPDTLSEKELDSIKESGLVLQIGDKLQVTGKGSEIIKVMVLGNDKSSFSKESNSIDYITAKTNVKSRSLKKENENKENDWWGRFF